MIVCSVPVSGQIGKRNAPEELAVDIDLNRRVGDNYTEVDGLLIEVQKFGEQNFAAAVKSSAEPQAKLRTSANQKSHIRQINISRVQWQYKACK